ncbi:hypothetical protein [Clostridium weizhouense]|uniref:Uncharacterized protein n=1 Tax=Clostridium weizhouense TaxID=2859781 RepID=A0ABS7AQJ3_9CLOT|nr:hypothetical protein [Clostridium weizhouense]MBW6410932.1 hypothetical protein [Clostridium weizhouense]
MESIIYKGVFVIRKSVLTINKQSFIYKRKEYLFNEFRDVKNLLSKNREFIIMEEELYARHFNESIRGKHIYEFIETKLNNEFHKNDDILYHYEYDKNRKIVSIYSIKGGKRLEILSEEANNILIKPIQFILKDIMIELFKEKDLNLKFIILIDEIYYYISLKQGKVYETFVEKEIQPLLNRLKNIELKLILNEEKSLGYLNKKISDFYRKINNNISTNIKLISISCGDDIDAIYEKQGFYSKKVL